MVSSSDIIGLRGEAIFMGLIARYQADGEPLFLPQFLGDKYPTVDFIVYLLGNGLSFHYFFVQVKTTMEGYTSREHRLKVQVKKEDVIRLTSCPAPTYLVGVDVNTEKAYLISAECMDRKTIRSIDTSHPIDIHNVYTLWQEVKEYWENVERPTSYSTFIDPKWSK